MTTLSPESSRGVFGRVAVWIATGLEIGLVCPAPGTFGTAIWRLPLAWVIGQLPGGAWQIAAIVAAILVGIPIATAAGRELGGKKDNQAIIWDEIATTPIVFLLVPLTGWKVAIAGFLAHRLFDIWKPPPARQLEALPDGLGVMADDCVAGVYGRLLMVAVAWALAAAGWPLASVAVGG